MNKISLKEVVNYTTQKISSTELNIDTYISTDNILQNKQGITSSLQLPVISGNIPKYDAGNILVSNIRPYLKKIYYAKKSGGVSNDVLTFQVKETFDSKFVYYSLFQDSFFEHMMSGSKGTKMPRGDKRQILDYKISKFDLLTQQKIASVLSALDDKIELNNRINAELEAMAKTLYDYWFVQFDFPIVTSSGVEKPYKTSGGKMVYNETLKREIPEGWEVKSLGELVKSINTGLNPRDHFKLGEGSNFYVTIKNIEYGRIILDNSCDKINNKSLERIQKRSNLEKGDILFTSIEPVGKTYLLQETPINWNINESVFSFKPNYEYVTSEHLFMLLSSDEIRLKCKNASTGSIHKGIRITPLKNFKIPLPPLNLINEFNSILKEILLKINNNQKQNQELSALRDWLLPMLMNGQVKVGMLD